jgi:hypothetical protein
MSHRSNEEAHIAREIVSVLPAESVVRVASDEQTLRFVVSNATMRLRSVVLSRSSLSRLAGDPLRSVKIEYLQRDLLRSAMRRAEFRYPRLSRVMLTARGRRKAQAAARLVLASVLP